MTLDRLCEHAGCIDDAAHDVSNELHPPTTELQQSLERLAAELVGHSPLDLATAHVRRAMLREALIKTAGNLTKTADILGVRRQAVQHMVIRYELRQWASNIRHRSRDLSVE